MGAFGRRLVAGFAPIFVTACDSPPTDPEPAQSPPVPAQMGPGLYAVGDGSTVYSRTRLNEDGTYFDLNDAGETVGNGTWVLRDEAICFDPEGDGEEQEERCWRNDPPDQDGSFVTRRIGSEQAYRVTPIEGRLADD